MNALSAAINPLLSFPPKKTDDILQQGAPHRAGEVGPIEVNIMTDRFVEESLFRSEIKRIDSQISQERKSQEKNMSSLEKAIDRLNEEIRGVRNEVKDFRVEVGAIFKWLIGTYISVMAVVLAAFYAFASYIRR
jgi:wobble nucleotide-excising tRNase